MVIITGERVRTWELCVSSEQFSYRLFSLSVVYKMG